MRNEIWWKPPVRGLRRFFTQVGERFVTKAELVTHVQYHLTDWSVGRGRVILFPSSGMQPFESREDVNRLTKYNNLPVFLFFFSLSIGEVSKRQSRKVGITQLRQDYVANEKVWNETWTSLRNSRAPVSSGARSEGRRGIETQRRERLNVWLPVNKQLSIIWQQL